MTLELNLCRVCLESDKDSKFENMFKNDDSIAENILLISNVMISKQHSIILICKSCIDQLNAALKFRENCRKADEYFQSLNLNVNKFIDKEERIQQKCSETEIIIDSFKRENYIKNSNIANQSNKKYECTKCAKLFSCRYYLQKHEYIRHTEISPEEYFVCDKCNYRSKTKSLIKAHLLHNHYNSSTKALETYQCKFCGRICKSPGALYGHEKTHKIVPKDEYLKCQHCSKSFKEKRLLKNHIQLVHEKSRMKQCCECGFIATCSGSLNKHRKAVHLKLRNHICDDCKQGFATNQQLLRHLRTHSGARPFPCLNSNCDKLFADSHGRKRHMKICSCNNKT